MLYGFGNEKKNSQVSIADAQFQERERGIIYSQIYS
jgi:hypothetical protein